MITEEQARKKFCPHMTYVVNENQSFDARFAVHYQSTCMASECMAWRWAHPVCERLGEGVGYCGLSGRPLGGRK